MSFVARMTRCPQPFDPGLGAEMAGQFADLASELRELVAGAAGSSPYLAGLLGKEGAWLRDAVTDPEGARDAVLAAIPLIDSELAARLRQAKRRLGLLAALADLAGIWPLETVTGTLTDLADAATDAAIRAAIATEVKRRKLPEGAGSDGTAGWVALAMGKMGAGELNYSSDIDLICLFDETRYAESDRGEARASLIRATRKMTATLSEITQEGYVFRTDLRLRPDASVTPVCISLGAAERYYESFGRTWERAAYIKARPAAGDIAAGARFLEDLTPFVWRKHLDFAAIEDAHQMRLRIRDEKGLHGAGLDGLNLKLGRGGIREIEFFTQTRQLISGGRDPSIRSRGTVESLQTLTEAGWIEAETAAALTGHYRAHREVEHRVQMIQDAQTHNLPRDAAGWDRLAALMGREAGALRSEIRDRLDEVHDLTEGFFAPSPAEAAIAPPPSFGAEVTERWLSYPALRSDRAATIFDRLRPQILARLSEAADPEGALAQFDTFLRGLPAGVQLFSLFDANPDLVHLLSDICASAPALSDYLSRNAAVLDAVIGGRFFAPWPGTETLAAELAQALEEAGDYEAQLDAARRWAKEWHFRIGVHLLRGLSDAETAGQHYADLAEAVLRALWPAITSDFATRHGPPPGRGAVVLGMGSLGAGWLTATSDLDLIVIYDADGVESSEGRRPLPSRSYYARLTQALVTALSAPMSQGRLYEVDMRLRPSGKQGPVATALTAFQAYQREEAWTWEHLALTRARPVAGPAELSAEVARFRQTLLTEIAARPAILPDTARMRRKLAESHGSPAPFDVKSGAGRLTDVELLASAAALSLSCPDQDPRAQLAAAGEAGWLDPAAVAELMEAITLFRQVRATARLLTGGVFDPDTLGEGARRTMLARTRGAADANSDMAALAERIARRAETTDRIITARLGGET